MKNRLVTDGGPGSGFFDHGGVAGQVGGSAMPGQGGGAGSLTRSGVVRKAGYIYELEELDPKYVTELEHPPYRSLDNFQARAWYHEADARIPDLIDRSKPVEEQARQACTQRIWNRIMTRELMSQQEGKDSRKELDETAPCKSFEQMVQHKIDKYGMTREQAFEDIVKTATKTNAEADKKYYRGGQK